MTVRWYEKRLLSTEANAQAANRKGRQEEQLATNRQRGLLLRIQAAGSRILEGTNYSGI